MAANDEKKQFLHKGTIGQVSPMYEVVCDCGRTSYNTSKLCDNPHCSASQSLPVVEVKGLHKPADVSLGKDADDHVHFVPDANAAKDAAKPVNGGAA